MTKIVFFIGLVCALSLPAQDYEFGEVSREELQETYNAIDSSASAAYLYKYRKTFFQYLREDGFQIVTEIHERIKIYDQEGFDYATKIISLYKNDSDDEEINGLKAYTYNLENGKIVGVKLDKKGVFRTEKNKYRNEVKFTMPNIKQGCVIEYKYRRLSPFVHHVEDFVFQHDIPVKQLDATFEVPEYFNFKARTKGFNDIMPVYSTKRDKLVYKNKVPINENNSYDSGVNYRTGEINFIKNIASYKLEDISALKDEPYVNNMDNYRSSIKYELSSTNYPSSPIKYYSTTWEDVVKTIYKSSSFGDELNKKGYFDDDIDALIGTVSDPIKKITLIFNYIKTKIKWNGYYNYLTDKGVKKAYKDQVGNVAEINLMLTAMLQYAGLKAYPVLVSTRSNGVPLFPTREGYNYVVTCVKLAEGDVLLDATVKYTPPNVLPHRILNWQGRIVSEHGGSELIDLYPKQKSKNNVIILATLNENGDINGQFRSIKTNHRALAFREHYNDVNKDNFLEKLENKYNGIEISDYTVKNDLSLSKPIIESYKFVKESQADIIGDKLYFYPSFFLRTSESPFKLEKREFPVDFGYPLTISYRVRVNLPAGYKVESLPEPGAFSLPDGLGLFKYKISSEANSVQLVVESNINESIITPAYYDILKTYFSQIVEKEGEQVVLTRI